SVDTDSTRNYQHSCWHSGTPALLYNDSKWNSTPSTPQHPVMPRRTVGLWTPISRRGTIITPRRVVEDLPRSSRLERQKRLPSQIFHLHGKRAVLLPIEVAIQAKVRPTQAIIAYEARSPR